jgi:hypothetical protein
MNPIFKDGGEYFKELPISKILPLEKGEVTDLDSVRHFADSLKMSDPCVNTIRRADLLYEFRSFFNSPKKSKRSLTMFNKDLAKIFYAFSLSEGPYDSIEWTIATLKNVSSKLLCARLHSGYKNYLDLRSEVEDPVKKKAEDLAFVLNDFMAAQAMLRHSRTECLVIGYWGFYHLKNQVEALTQCGFKIVQSFWDENYSPYLNFNDCEKSWIHPNVSSNSDNIEIPFSKIFPYSGFSKTVIPKVPAFYDVYDFSFESDSARFINKRIMILAKMAFSIKKTKSKEILKRFFEIAEKQKGAHAKMVFTTWANSLKREIL